MRIGYSGRATPAASLEEIALPKIANVPDRPREELREHHRLPPEEGVIALRTIVSVLRRLGQIRRPWSRSPLRVRPTLKRGGHDASASAPWLPSPIGLSRACSLMEAIGELPGGRKEVLLARHDDKYLR